MVDFKQQLRLYLKGELELDQVEEALVQFLRQSPQHASAIRQGLEGLSEKGGIPTAAVATLLAVIAEEEAKTELEVEDDDRTVVAPRPITTDTPDDDRTVVGGTAEVSPIQAPPDDDDRTRITGFGGAPQVQQEHTEDDKTRINIPANPVESGGTPTATHTQTTGTTGWNKPFVDDDDALVGVGSLLKDRFRLVEFIGAGGMGDVYIAEDSLSIEADDVDTQVAVKVLNKEFRDHPESFRAMQREARKTMDLAHPNIVNVFTFDRDQANAFMVMELMRGLPLDKAIKQQPYGFPLDQVESYVGGMGEALKYAHQRGVIHCDFKPSNIFVDDDVIKVFDFGIARAATNSPQNQKQDSFDAGDLGAFTPSYASIELIESADEVDPRDDIYALGCITYELLAGSHPFLKDGRKIPANEALTLGLEPERIKKLSRRQWKALQSALALKQGDRVPSVELFLGEFLQQERRAGFLSRWYMWPVVGLAIAGASYFPIRDWMDRKAIDEFADSLDGLGQEDIAVKLKSIEQYDAELQEQYFSHRKVENTLMNYFQQSIQDNAKGDEYVLADRLATRAIQIYKNSAAFTNAIEMAKAAVQKEKKNRLNQLNDQLNGLLALSAEDFAHQIQDVEHWRGVVIKVQPDHSMRQDPRLPVKYIEVAETLAKNKQFALAKQVLASGQTLFPQQSELAAVAESLVLQQRKNVLASQLKEIKQRISPALAQQFDLETLQSLESDIRDLRDMAPEADLLKSLDKQLKQALEPKLSDVLASYQWADADLLLGQYEWALTAGALRSLEQKVTEARSDYEDQVDTLIRKLDTLVLNGKLTGRGAASELYAQLERFNPATETLTDARASIAQGWLKKIRQARINQQWDKAHTLIKDGKSAAGNEWAISFEEELEKINAAQQGASQQLLADQKADQLKKTQMEINGLADQFEGLFGSKEPTLTTSREALAILDQIEALEGNHPLIDQGHSQLIDQYMNTFQSRLTSNQPEEALRLAEEGRRLFPDEKQIADSVEQAQLALNQLKADQRQQQFAELNRDAEALLAVDKLNDVTSVAFDQLLEEMVSLGADSDQVQSLRTQAAISYVRLAQILTADNRFEAANEALNTATRYDADLGTISSQVAATSKAQEQYSSEQESRRLAARIDGLKQSFRTQVSANDIKQATTTYKELAGKLPADDLFIQQEGPDAIVSAYLRVTEQLAKRNSYTRAIKLLQGARPYATDITVVDEKQREYERDRSLYLVGVAVNKLTLEKLVQAHSLMKELKDNITEERFQTLDQRLQDAALKRAKALVATDFDLASALLQKAKLFYPNNASIQTTELTPPLAPVKEAVTDPKDLLAERFNDDVQASSGSVVKLLNLKAELTAARKKLVSTDYDSLDRQLRSSVVKMLSVQVKAKSTSAKGLLTQAQKLWPEAKDITSIQWPASSALVGVPCTNSLAGYGSRRKAVCYDMLEKDQKAPYMIVSPPLQGSVYAISKFEISVGDFNRYCGLSGHCGGQKGNLKAPMASLSVSQINEYAAWLSEKTGTTYRLPTVEEWRHVAGATGKRQPRNYNCRLTQGGTVLKGKSIQEAYSGKGNGWGFVNYLGNVQELAMSGSTYVALGGNYKDSMSQCSIKMSRPAVLKGNADTGFRLVREM